MVWKVLGLSLVLAGTSHHSVANSFSDKPYLLRLPFSLDRASNYSDTAARLASTAYTGRSSANPAADAFPRQRSDDRRSPATFTTINALSDSGAWIAAFAISSSLDADDGSVWSPAYAYTATPDADNTEDLDNTLESHEFFLGWSKALSNDLSIGAQVRLVPAEIRQETYVAEVGFQPLRYDTDQFAADLWLGMLVRVSDRVTAGAVITLGWAETETDIRNLTALGPIPSGTKLDGVDDDARTRGLKLGIGYRVSSILQLYADAQYFSADSNVAGSLDVGRISGGIETHFTSTISGILGVMHDTESETTFGIGLGYRPDDDIHLHLAYQNNGAPEIEKEFGRIDYINASLAMKF